MSFFLGTLVFLALANRRIARQVWLTGFLAVLLVVTVVGMPLLPVVDMHKFSQPADEERTFHELRVGDEFGAEISYDLRAVPPTTGSRTSSVARLMADEYTDEERMEMAEFYLSNAKEYRTEVEAEDRTTLTERAQPPRYTDSRQWSADELEEYGEFESIHVYQRTLTAADDNTEVESDEERRRLTIDVINGTVTEHEEEGQ